MKLKKDEKKEKMILKKDDIEEESVQGTRCLDVRRIGAVARIA